MMWLGTPNLLSLLMIGCTAPSNGVQLLSESRMVASAPNAATTPIDDDVPTTPSPNAAEKAETFDDLLTLDSARAIALRGSPTIHAAQARLEKAQARVQEAQARYSPTVLFTQQSARVFLTPSLRNQFGGLLDTVPLGTDNFPLGLDTLATALGLPSSGGSGANSNSFSEHLLSFSAQWLVFDGFVREAVLAAARHLREAAECSQRDVERLLIRAVDQTYYQIQLAQERLRIAAADEAFGREQLTETEKLFRAGRIQQSDVDNFRVRVLAAQAAVTTGIGLRETGRTVLAELLGIEGSSLPESYELSALAVETETDMASTTPEPWIAAALEHRPDLEQWRHLIETEEQRVRAARGAYYPSVGVGAAWGLNRASNFRFENEDQTAAAGIELQWELFSGGTRRAKVLQAEAGQSEAMAELHRLRLSILSEIRRAVIEVSVAQQQITLQRERLTTAQENRRVVRAAYLAGKESLSRLNETQRDFIAADADLSLARIRLRQAWSELHSAAATSSREPGP